MRRKSSFTCATQKCDVHLSSSTTLHTHISSSLWVRGFRFILCQHASADSLGSQLLCMQVHDGSSCSLSVGRARSHTFYFFCTHTLLLHIEICNNFCVCMYNLECVCVCVCILTNANDMILHFAIFTSFNEYIELSFPFFSFFSYLRSSYGRRLHVNILLCTPMHNASATLGFLSLLLSLRSSHNPSPSPKTLQSNSNFRYIIRWTDSNRKHTDS